MSRKKPRKLEKIIFGIGCCSVFSLALSLQIPLTVNGQEPVIKKDGLDGYLYVGYDFNKDSHLDLIKQHFYLGDQTISYHVYPVPKNSLRWNHLQQEYKQNNQKK